VAARDALPQSPKAPPPPDRHRPRLKAPGDERRPPLATENIETAVDIAAALSDSHRAKHVASPSLESRAG
jgi:hypothetical protein